MQERKATTLKLSESRRALWRLMVGPVVHLRHLLWAWFHNISDLLASKGNIWKFLAEQYQGLVHVLVRCLAQRAANSQCRSAQSRVGRKESLLIDCAG